MLPDEVAQDQPIAAVSNTTILRLPRLNSTLKLT